MFFLCGSVLLLQKEGTSTNPVSCDGSQFRCPSIGYASCRYQVYSTSNSLVVDSVLQPGIADPSSKVGAKGCYLFGYLPFPGTSPTTTTLPSINIIQPTKGYFRTDEKVVMEARTSGIPDFSFVTAQLSGVNYNAEVTSQSVGGKVVFDLGMIPSNIEGYDFLVAFGSTSDNEKIIVRPVLVIQLSTPVPQQYVNEPVIVCMKIVDEDGFQLGVGEIDTLKGTARYIGTTRYAQIANPSFQGKNNLCPWKFSIAVAEKKDILFTGEVTRAGSVSDPQSITIKVSTASILVNFVDTPTSGTLNKEKIVRFETLNPQGGRIKTTNTVVISEPNGFTVTDVSSQIREISDGLYTFSFTPDQIEAWTIDVVSSASGLETGSSSFLVSVSKDDSCAENCDNPPPPDIPLTFWLIIGGFVVSVIIGSKLKG